VSIKRGYGEMSTATRTPDPALPEGMAKYRPVLEALRSGAGHFAFLSREAEVRDA
jgi:hypothetical protein